MISDVIGPFRRTDWLPVGDGTPGEQTQRSSESLSEASDEDGESEDEDPETSGDEDPDDSDVSELWRYREEEDDAEDYPFTETAGRQLRTSARRGRRGDV